MSDNENKYNQSKIEDLSSINLEDKKEELLDPEDTEIKILMIVRDFQKQEEVASFLSRRGWPTTVKTNIGEAIQVISAEVPDFIIISMSHTNPKISKLPLILAQTFNKKAIVFGEGFDPQTQQKLNNSTFTHVMHEGMSGPSIHRRIKKIILNERVDYRYNGIISQKMRLDTAENSMKIKGGENSDSSYVNVAGVAQGDGGGLEKQSRVDKALQIENLMKMFDLDELKESSSTKSEIYNPQDQSHFNNKNESKSEDKIVKTAKQEKQDLDYQNNNQNINLVYSMPNQDTEASSEQNKGQDYSDSSSKNKQENTLDSSQKEEQKNTLNFQEGAKSNKQFVIQDGFSSNHNSAQDTKAISENKGNSCAMEQSSENINQKDNGVNSNANQEGQDNNSNQKKITDAGSKAKESSLSENNVHEINEHKIKLTTKKSSKIELENKLDVLSPRISTQKRELNSKINLEKDKKRRQLIKSVDLALKKSCEPGQVINKKIGIVNHLWVVLLSSETVTGYLTLTTPYSGLDISDFLNNFRSVLIQELTFRNIKMLVDTVMKVPIKSVDYVDWADNSSVFSILDQHKDFEIGVSFYQNEEVIMSEGSAFKGKTPIGVEKIKTNVSLKFPVYIFFEKNNKYYKYLQRGRRLLESQKVRLLKNNVKDLYIDVKDFEIYKSYYAESELNSFIDVHKTKKAA